VKYLLDTNAVIHAIRGRPSSVRSRLDAEGPARVAVSAITVADLAYGAVKSDRAGRHELFAAFLEPYEVLPFDSDAAYQHGTLRHQLRHQPIGERDLFIAAIAHVRGLTVVTANRREFDRVPELRVEDWSA